MKSSVEVLSTPTADTPGACLLLDFADRKYLIGQAHEGCQRAIVQRGKKLVKISDLFLTGRVEWKNIGGLIGLVITAADSKITASKASREMLEEKRERKLQNLRKDVDNATQGSVKWEGAQRRLIEEQEKQRLEKEEEKSAVPDGIHRQPLGIHGGRNIMHSIATGRRFIFRKGMPLDVQEITGGSDPATWEPTWSDANINVWAIPVTPDNLTEADDGPKDREEVLKGVIGHMFDSDWRLDALFETPLAEVRMPAALFVRDPVTRKLTKWAGPKPGEVSKEKLPKVNVLVRKPWPAAMVGKLPRTTPSLLSMSYLIKNHTQRGRFLPAKAKELGVPVIKFRELTAGNNVTLDDGTVVTPEQVLGPGKEGGGFMVIDLPSTAYVKGLVERPEWQSSKLMNGIDGIFWLLGSGVVHSTELQSFIKGLTSIKHVISSKEHTPNYLAFESVATSQLQLAGINQNNHPVLVFDEKAESLPGSLGDCAVSHPGQVLHLEPKGLWDVSAKAPFLDCEAVLQNSSSKLRKTITEINEELRRDRPRIEGIQNSLLGGDAEIITLGTGSALPSKNRNVSATLLRVPGKGSYLFDAGENTLGQLSRMYNPDQLLEILKDLRMIWISHMHADHHLGIISVIKAWHNATSSATSSPKAKSNSPKKKELNDSTSSWINKDKLFVVSDGHMIDFLKEYAAAEDFGFIDVIGIAVEPAEAGKPETTKMFWNGNYVGFNSSEANIRDAMREGTGLADLQIAPVEHCNGARAIAITFDDGFKVSYSGDCRPSKRFVEIGKNSTLLIHEATFDDELAGDAIAKKHSTVSEAIRVGIEMGVPRIMLTHFSQRYSKVTSMDKVESYQVRFEDADPDAPEDAPIGDPLENADGYGDSLLESKGEMGTQNPKIKDDSGLDGDSTAHSGANAVAGNGRKSKDLKVGMAFDYMRVKVKDMALLEKFTPAINILFEESEVPVKGDDSPKKRKRDELQEKSGNN